MLYYTNMESLLAQIRGNWVIITFLVTIIIWSANVNTRLAQAEYQIHENQSALQYLQDIKVSIAVIQEKLTAIEKKI